MALTLRVAVVALVAVVSVWPAAAQTPTKEELLARVAAYVSRFVTQFANVVAEEQYASESLVIRRSRITSDFLLVKYPGEDAGVWLTFRDVLEVDGRRLRDQQERLAKLFLEPFDSASRRASQITLDSARYIATTTNPLLVVAFLQASYQPRFRFTLGDIDRSLNGPAGARAVHYQEVTLPTIIQGVRGATGVSPNRPASGTVWIEEATGRVVRTQLRLGVAPNTSFVDTTFRYDDALGTDVPAEMRESFIARGGAEVKAVATYGRFRRFQVRAEEDIKVPPAQ